MKGRIHSTESFGTVDGPGVRFVIFMQGCPLRCKYCHNPDSWEMGSGTEKSAEELLEMFQENRFYYRNGGITVTGGEPLMQIDFLIEFFEKAKEMSIHTCLDTSGITYNSNNGEYLKKLDRLMDSTDLVMLDIKHIDPDAHILLTAQSNKNILAFAKYLDQRQTPMWVRHVVIPGITDNASDLYELGRFIGTLSNIKALDILPYHTMGAAKYKNMGLENPLEGVPDLSKEDAVKAKKFILDGIRDSRNEIQI